MKRSPSGVFGAGVEPLPPLAPGDGGARQSYRGGTLQLRFSGPPPAAASPLCLFDGHLDNGAQLAAELGEASWTGDPEALLARGYRRWGDELPARLRGDFALLVWDPGRERGLLARDQLGVRPLFLHEGGGLLRFAGEVRDLLALLPTRPAPDVTALAHWLALAPAPADRTLYAGIRRLGPGEMLLLEGGRVRRRRYWSPRYREPGATSFAEDVASTSRALRLAVERRRDGVRTAVLLSGGLDSSAVAAFCAGTEADPPLALSGAFPEHPALDESGLVGLTSAQLSLPLLQAAVRPGGLVASAAEHVDAWQMPLLSWGDFWALPLLRAGVEAGARTVLDGDGGDEVFAPRGHLLADLLRGGRARRAWRLARELPGGGSAVGRRDVARMYARLAIGGALPAPAAGARWRARRVAPSWLAPALRDQLGEGAERELAWRRLDGPRWWAHEADALAYGIEAAGVFEHQRRRAELAGIEARHPLLDLDLVEHCLGRDPVHSFDPRFSRPLLRGCVEGMVPDAVRLRPEKARFEALIIDCLDADWPLVTELLAGPDCELRRYLDPGPLQERLLDRRALRRVDPFGWMWALWRLLNAELWLRLQAGGSLALASLEAASGPRVELSRGRNSYVFPP